MTLVDVVCEPGVGRAELLRLAGAWRTPPNIRSPPPSPRVPAPRPVTYRSSWDSPTLRAGVQGVVDGKSVIVGREALLADRSQVLSDEVAAAKVAAEHGGKTVVAVGWDGAARGSWWSPTPSNRPAHRRSPGSPNSA